MLNQDSRYNMIDLNMANIKNKFVGDYFVVLYRKGGITFF